MQLRGIHGSGKQKDGVMELAAVPLYRSIPQHLEAGSGNVIGDREGVGDTSLECDRARRRP